MEIATKLKLVREKLTGVFSKIKGSLIVENELSQKIDLNFRAFKTMGAIGILVFIAVVFIMPTEVPVEFTEKIDRQDSKSEQRVSSSDSVGKENSAQVLWASPEMSLSRSVSRAQVNYDTSMLIGAKGGNAKTELRAGIRMPLRILDKVVVSQESVPILAELILDSQSDSGLKIPAGTRFYGEVSFQKGSERATIRFSQISLPSGKIRKISAQAFSKDGQMGVPGRVFSDGMKNTAGQILTTFVGGLAAGSMETDIFGRSKGGIENGLLGAVSATAQSRAQVYGEKLKTEREWIELAQGIECDAVLSESMRLQEGGDEYER